MSISAAYNMTLYLNNIKIIKINYLDLNHQFVNNM